MTKSGPALDGSLQEWRQGTATFEYWWKNKLRNLAFAFALPATMIILTTTGILIGQHYLGWPLLALKIILTGLYIGLAVLVTMLVIHIHKGAIVLPMFDNPIPPFEPLPLPENGNYDAALRRGVQIGRWQYGSKGRRPGPPAWMPIKNMPGVFVAGEAGMGKSTFIHGVLRQLSKFSDAGIVRNAMFDYKAGMEMDVTTTVREGSPALVARDHFHYGAEWGSPKPIDGMKPSGKMGHDPATGEAVWGYEETATPHLRRYVNIMRQRAEDLRGTGREHVPSASSPHYVIFIDEAAQFARDHVPRPIQLEIAGLIDTLANQGRACGFTLVVCTQYPSLDHIRFRHGLLWGLCLKVKTPQAVDMVLGEGARYAGKRADRLPRNELHPERFGGIGYMGQSGSYGAMPLRLAHVVPQFPKSKSLPEPEVVETMPVFPVYDGSVDVPDYDDYPVP